MAHLTVKLQPTSVAYDPNDNHLKHGDTVSFERDGRGDEITVTFTNGSPFGGSSTITVGTAQAASSPATVQSNAAYQSYPFYFNEEERRGKERPNPPGTVAGELEVVDEW
jgi:plastocyanin